MGSSPPSAWQLADTNGIGVVRERYWLTFQPGEIRTCASCHGVNTADQAGHPPPTNSPLALVSLLNYWKTNASLQSALVATQGAPRFQMSFIRRPAELGVTYHVQASTDLLAWSDISSYAGTNILLTAQATEVSRAGSSDETVTLRDNSAVSSQTHRFLRVNVTRP